MNEGRTYQLGAGEREVQHARAAESTRLERLRQVRDQEKLWARFKAREYRASVSDHHAELTYQLHEGWVKARNDKQRELERDYSSAVMGLGQGHFSSVCGLYSPVYSYTTRRDATRRDATRRDATRRNARLFIRIRST